MTSLTYIRCSLNRVCVHFSPVEQWCEAKSPFSTEIYVAIPEGEEKQAITTET